MESISRDSVHLNLLSKVRDVMPLALATKVTHKMQISLLPAWRKMKVIRHFRNHNLYYAWNMFLRLLHIVKPVEALRNNCQTELKLFLQLKNTSFMWWVMLMFFELHQPPLQARILKYKFGAMSLTFFIRPLKFLHLR